MNREKVLRRAYCLLAAYVVLRALNPKKEIYIIYLVSSKDNQQ